MKLTSLVSAVLAVALCAPQLARAADDESQETLYLAVECMQSAAADYADVESAIWLPMHQELVDRGLRNSWALYRVVWGDRASCDFYTVTSYLGTDQLNADPMYETVHKSVHPRRKFMADMSRTWASRRLLRSELWQAVDRTEIGPHRFAIVNLMQADDPDAYERMESQFFKPAHEALIASGDRSGWAVYELLSPLGTSIGYNYSTVDFVNHLKPVPMAETMLAAHPDRDLEELYSLLALRQQVRSETWERVAATQRPASE